MTGSDRRGGKSLILVCLFLLGVFAASTGYSLFQIHSLRTEIAFISEKGHPYAGALQNVALAAKAAANDERGYLIRGDPGFLEEIWSQRLPKVRHNLTLARSLVDEKRGRELELISESIQSWSDSMNAEFSLFKTDPEAARVMSLEKTRPLRKAYEKLLAAQIAEAGGEIASRSRLVSEQSEQSGRLMLGFLMLGLTVSLYSLLTAHRASLVLRAHQEQQDRMAARHCFESRLHKGLDMATTEAQAHSIIERAFGEVFPGQAELLLADASNAHFSQVASNGCGPGAGCRVQSPFECAAVRLGQTVTFARAGELDSCRYLDEQRDGKFSATCVPVTIMGQSVGVIHALGEEGSPPLDEDKLVEIIAQKSGERLGMLRAFAKSEVQASTDPLTGLLNRRSLEERAKPLFREGEMLSVVYCDLDRFKRLNDVHGHAAGDKALRLFSETLTRVFGERDLICRFGGEEFVLLLVGLDRMGAARKLNVLRTALKKTLSGGSVPTFTASFGVADSEQFQELDALLKHADRALIHAKRTGRDKICFAEEVTDENEQTTSPLPVLSKASIAPNDDGNLPADCV